MSSGKLPPIGTYKPMNIEKYIGDHTPVFRSSWEHRMMYFLDNNPNIIRWGSELVQVPYMSPKDGEIHRYFVDFYAEVRTKYNTRDRWIIEVKPKKQLSPPPTKNRSKKTVLTETMQYAVNKAKFGAAEAYAKANNLKFVIFTEDDIF